MPRPELIIMVKEPRPGRVKTRLGCDIGPIAATWWFRHQTRALIRRMRRDPRWRVVLAVSPDAEGLASRVWPANLQRRAQGGGDLGARMARQLRATDGPSVVIGADIPGITPAHIARAFRALGDHDAVFGPAPDGGYWLVGMQRVPKGAFEGVRWSTEHALADTVATLPGGIAMIETLRDVDTLADLRAL